MAKPLSFYEVYDPRKCGEVLRTIDEEGGEIMFFHVTVSRNGRGYTIVAKIPHESYCGICRKQFMRSQVREIPTSALVRMSADERAAITPSKACETCLDKFNIGRGNK